MSREPNRDTAPDVLLVPEGILDGIDDLAKGRTASKEDIEAALKF